MIAVHIHAIVENDCLRPTVSRPFAEGAEVNVVVMSISMPHQAKRLASALEKIAALPLESHNPSDSGEDHDRFLYGDE